MSRTNALLYTALERTVVAKGDVTSLRVKPKLQLMQELIEYQCLEAGSPCEYWTSKDESWGARLAKVAMRRGQQESCLLPCFVGDQQVAPAEKMKTCVGMDGVATLLQGVAPLGPEQGPNQVLGPEQGPMNLGAPKIAKK